MHVNKVWGSRAKGKAFPNLNYVYVLTVHWMLVELEAYTVVRSYQMDLM